MNVGSEGLNDLPAAPLEAVRRFKLIRRLAGGQHEQHLPEVVTTVQPRESPRGSGTYEAVERRQSDIFLVVSGPGAAGEVPASQTDQPGEVSGPKSVDRLGVVAGLEPFQPHGDAAELGHGAWPSRQGAASVRP